MLKTSVLGLRAGLATFALIVVGLFASGPACAEFPEKPIRLVVGFGPGTGSDIQGRALADALAREIKTPVVVDNRPGAAGMLAASYVAGAAPDGYTLIMGTTTLMMTLPLLSRNAKYDVMRDFSPIASLGKSPFLVLVANRPGSPTGLKELLSRIKSSSTNYGSLGNGSFGHLATLRLLQQTALQATNVPYKSSPQELQDLAGGNLDFVIDSTTAALPLVKNGLLRALAVTSTTRLASLPDVPTVAEVLGTPFEHTVWTGLFAPGKTPPEVIRKLGVATSAALQSSELRARYTAMELQPFALDAAAFADYLGGELPAWRSFLSKNDIRIDE